MRTNGQDVGILVIGAGFLGSLRCAAVKAAFGTRLVAVHDRDQTIGANASRRFGVEFADDLHEALRRNDVDAVIVATPHADHFEQAMAALETGKHVLCEKPLTVRPVDARLLSLRADELRLRLATGLNHRFYPPVADALAIAGAGGIGKVESVRMEIGHLASPEFLSGWHTDVSRSGGGTLMDNGPHACDLIRGFLGEIVAAKGYVRQSHNLPRGCEPEAFALFRDFDQGFAELRSSWCQPTGYLTIDVRGSRGRLHVETAPWRLTGELSNGQVLRRSYLRERVAERLFRLKHGCERSLVREIEAFVSNQKEATRPEAHGWDGCRATEMIDAVYRSSETGEEILLEPPLVNLPSSARRRVLGGQPV